MGGSQARTLVVAKAASIERIYHRSLGDPKRPVANGRFLVLYQSQLSCRASYK
jgi:hypothetical protein